MGDNKAEKEKIVKSSEAEDVVRGKVKETPGMSVSGREGRQKVTFRNVIVVQRVRIIFFCCDVKSRQGEGN